MSTETPAVFRLKASMQTYEWGKKGSSSLVSQLARGAVREDFELEEETSYAELWMGTHQNGPAHLWSEPETSLAGLITSSPQSYLGAKLTTGQFNEPGKFPHSTQVPFIFKILSIAKALPLQAHPDKALAEDLHAKDSLQFVDDNHKPEIAVALKDGFRGFVGFKEMDNIVESLQSVPELAEAIDNEDAIRRFLQEKSKESLKDVFSALLSAKEDLVKRCVGRLIERIDRQGANAVGGDESASTLVRTLNDQYPSDVGVLAAPFFMNLVTLNRGEAIYIGADEVHAYLEGDIIECMAVSDNVLNAAFVPPDSRNTSTFVNSLTYTSRPPSHWSLPQTPYKLSRTGQTTAYDPPLEEFTVLHTQLSQSRANFTASATKDASMSTTGIVSKGDFLTLDQGAQTVKDWNGKEVLRGAAGPTIGIVTRGMVECREEGGDFATVPLGFGGVVFVKPGTEVSVQAVQGEAEMWWATCAE
ncbi:mannose-6-phosphate isomerase [Schizopora paradoxa]|uniref:Mannose-6-phosphate isomerase n=1 Tax=Schizopora paradoxa TaxID=27342 RepID=A0A0H2R866_9AGAM|nr:mannose-6-phosphate isomerase [Schizopora paradoxa]